MESLILISCFILLGVTGFYIWTVQSLLKQLQQEHETYKTILDKQIKITSMPHLHCDMQYDVTTNTVKLETFNIGSTPAYDVLINIIGSYTAESLDIPSLMRTVIQPRYRKYPLEVDKVGYYGIRSSARTPMLPFQRRLVLPLPLPLRPVDVYVLLQFREVLGWNYTQAYCFSDIDETGKYRANILEPVGLHPLERLHLHDLDDVDTTTLDKSVPYQIVDFIDLWNHSISHRFTTLYVEGHGMPEVQSA
jgi:hypothetical protein